MSNQPVRSSEGGAPEWMVSYADMITIIMAFFVVLYATTSGAGKNDKGHATAESSAQAKNEAGGGNGQLQMEEDEDEKLKKVVDSLYNRFGPKWTVANCWVGGSSSLHANVSNQKSSKELRSKSMMLKGHLFGGNAVALPATQQGAFVVPGGLVLFDEFSADIDESQKKHLSAVAGELAGKLQKIEIRGHTSRRPMPTESKYHDHLDLAYARCRKVLEYLASHGVDSRRMRISVAGENEPAGSLRSAGYGEKNSRVEIRLLNEWLRDADNEQGSNLNIGPPATEQQMTE